MAAPTIEEIKAMDFGYLTGIDLLRYCPFQVLQKQFAVDDQALIIGCDIAESEALSKLGSRYDISTELGKTDTARFPLMIKIIAILAIRNIVGNQAGLPENMTQNFVWVDAEMLNIRNGQTSLTGLDIAADAKKSGTELIDSSFETLG